MLVAISKRLTAVSQIHAHSWSLVNLIMVLELLQLYRKVIIPSAQPEIMLIVSHLLQKRVYKMQKQS